MLDKRNEQRTMKKLLLPCLVILSTEVFATTDFVDTAQVISSTPIVEQANESRQECSGAAESGKQECRTVTTTREYVKGYAVVYRYNGRDIKTMLPSDPGPTVRVGIGVIDGAPERRAPAPAASALGTNVREVVQPQKTLPPPPASTVPAENKGGFQYRY
jgi:hypothetical protein